jgi:hypothetical protein
MFLPSAFAVLGRGRLGRSGQFVYYMLLLLQLWCCTALYCFFLDNILTGHPYFSFLLAIVVVQILNFYDLSTHKHLKTVPIMEELEGVVTLSKARSDDLLGVAAASSGSAVSKRKKGSSSSSSSSVASAARAFVLVCAGEKGVVKFFSVAYKGSKDAASFAITPLVQFSLKNAPLSSVGGGAANLASSLAAVAALSYMQKSEQLLVATQDYNLCFYSLSSVKDLIKASAAAGAGAAVEDASSAASANSHLRVKPGKLLIGSHGDILDMALLPARRSSSDGSSNSSSSSSATGAYELALVTNSSQVRIVDEAFSCRLLEGHSDIVLSVGCSPDG